MPEHGVLVVEVGLRAKRKKKLRPIRVRPLVGHRQHSSRIMGVVRVELIRKGAAPDRLAALARSRRVAALDHEARHEAVEGRAVVRAGRGQGQEIEGAARRGVASQFQFEVA